MVYKCHSNKGFLNNPFDSGIESIKKIIFLPIDFIKKFIPF